MKEFYKKANSLLKIKRNNPVVTKVIREDELGEAQVFEEKSSVENVIAQYFNDIYKRPDYRRRHFRSDNFDVDDDEVMLESVKHNGVDLETTEAEDRELYDHALDQVSEDMINAEADYGDYLRDSARDYEG
jgi:hypothetical protein